METFYLLDLDEGVLSTPAVVGEFNGRRGEFYDQEEWKGRAILVRYVWSGHITAIGAHGAIFLGGRRQELGSQLDLRAVTIAVPVGGESSRM